MAVIRVSGPLRAALISVLIREGGSIHLRYDVFGEANAISDMDETDLVIEPAGDCFTKHGCPLWAPFCWRDRGLRWCSTNRWSERLFARAQGAMTLGLVVVAGLVAAR